MADATLLISDEEMLRHEGAPGHPENPFRLRAILEEMRAPPVDGARWARPRAVERSTLELAHDRSYLDRIEGARGRVEVLDWDTAASPGTVRAAELSTGAVIDAIDALMSDRCARAFALNRPPGHHAEVDRAMGFCFFSNIAVGTLHAIAHLCIERVLVLDWDVHHGNGTQHILEGRPEALFVSLHQHPLYPGTGWLDEIGRGDGEGYTVNVPMPAGCGDAEYLAVMDELVVPIAETYRPQLVLVSAGFDAHAGDPLGGMEVTTEGFRAMCARARGIAQRHAGGRIALVLEGGYDLAALASSVRACVEDLAGARPGDEVGAPAPTETARMVIDRTRRAQARWWGRALGVSAGG